MIKDLVSIIIPTYNRPLKLKNAIDSVLMQDYKKKEIIIVDDNNPESNSRKETELLLKQYQEYSNIRYIKHPHNMNGAAARNTGYKASKGEYIMFLDDDDEFLPGKITAQKDCLDKRDYTWGACYTTYIVKNVNGKITVKSTETREGDLLIEELKRNLYIGAGSNLMIRRSVLEDVGGFDEKFIRNQDQEFLTRILQKYKLAYTPIQGIIINAHPKKEKVIVDFELLTKQYIETFNHIIRSYPQKKQEEILTVLNLQRIRVMLLNNKKPLRALSIAKESNIGLLLIIRYAIYLLKRKITKNNYGFNYSKGDDI